MSRQRFLPHWPTIVRFLRDSRSDWRPKALLILSVVYLVFPFDLVPDLLPLVGWLDDLGGLTIASLYVLHASRRYEAMIEQKIRR